MAPRPRRKKVRRRTKAQINRNPRGSRLFAFRSGPSNLELARQFSNELREKTVGLTALQVRQVQSRVIFQAARILVQGTPVDKGRARGGWQVEVGREPSFVDRIDKVGSATLGSIRELMNFYVSTQDHFEPVWLANSVPYIEILDRGLKVANEGDRSGSLVPFSGRGHRFFENAINYVRSQFI